MSKLLFTTVAAAGLFLAGPSSQAQAGYAPYGHAPVYYGYADYGYADYGYVPVYRTAVVPVPLYPARHHHHHDHNHHNHRGNGIQIRTPGFNFGYYR